MSLSTLIPHRVAGLWPHKTVAAVVLLLLTLALFSGVERFESRGEELLHDRDFPAQPAAWRVAPAADAVRFAAGTAVLESTDSARRLGLAQTLPIPQDRTAKLRLSADIATESVVPGHRPWRRARLLLVGRDAAGKRLWRYPHQVAALEGTHAWQSYTQVFDIPAEAVQIEALVQLDRATGRLSIRNISLMQVQERPGFRIAAYGLLAAWAIVLLWIAIGVLQAIASGPARWLAGGLGLVVTAGLLLPGQYKLGVLAALAGVAGTVLPTGLSPILQDVGETPEALFQTQTWDTVGHLVAFAALAIVLRVVRAQDRFATTLLQLMLFAGISEVLQFFVAGRGPEWFDWQLDVCGAAFGIAVIDGVIRPLRRMTSARRRPTDSVA